MIPPHSLMLHMNEEEAEREHYDISGDLSKTGTSASD